MSLNKISGDDAWMDPPVPIPNTVVKHPEAESTCLVTGWEARKLPVAWSSSKDELFYFTVRARTVPSGGSLCADFSFVRGSVVSQILFCS